MALPQAHGLGRDVRDGRPSLRECVVSTPDVEASSLSLDLLRAFIKTSMGKTATVDQKHPHYWCCFLLLRMFCNSHFIVLAEAGPGLTECEFFISGLIVLPFLF